MQLFIMTCFFVPRTAWQIVEAGPAPLTFLEHLSFELSQTCKIPQTLIISVSQTQYLSYNKVNAVTIGVSAMADGYEYPLIDGLNVDEIIDVVNFYQMVEQAYEQSGGVKRSDFLAAYRKFQKILPSKMEEKQLEREFENRSGYDAYQVIKASKDAQSVNLKIHEAQHGN